MRGSGFKHTRHSSNTCAVSNSNYAVAPFLCPDASVRAQSGPLEEARMCMNNFEASEGVLRFLEEAHSRANTAFVQGHNLHVRLSAAVIYVASGYVQMSKASTYPLSTWKS